MYNDAGTLGISPTMAHLLPRVINLYQEASGLQTLNTQETLLVVGKVQAKGRPQKATTSMCNIHITSYISAYSQPPDSLWQTNTMSSQHQMQLAKYNSSGCWTSNLDTKVLAVGIS